MRDLVNALSLRIKMGRECEFGIFLLILDLVLKLKDSANRRRNALEESYSRHFLWHQTVLQRSSSAQILYSSPKILYALFGAKPPLAGLGGSNEDEKL